MEVLYSRCAGLDVHKRSVSACIRIQQGQEVHTETAKFGTFTRDLQRMRDWLIEQDVQQVAMESTGVFWIPVWNVLEQSGDKPLQLTLINPQHVHALPGRKTDRQDCERIAELHQHGLLRGSFIPPAPIRALRDLTRRRTQLQGERNRTLNRISQLLETVNVKLASVVSDISGKTARLILAALVRGRSTPDQMAELAQASLKNKKAELSSSLEGFCTDHFRWLLGQALSDLQHLDRGLAQVDRQLGHHLRPHADLIRRLCTIPGVDFTAAAAIVAEVGFDMSRFPDAAHLASWAGLCPGNNESAGKRFSTRTRKGNRYLRRVLTQSAWSITHKKDCFLTGLFYRIASRGGMKKAALAVAHRILIFVWHVIARGTSYCEPGANYSDRKQPERAARRLARRLQEIGFEVELRPKETARTAALRTKGKVPPHQDSPPRPGRPPADPAICLKCAKWGIPCIHARNSARRFTAPLLPEEPTT